ncbi:hypothetical protein BCR33DRAFT_720307 [Rhizoclosmatium globosum]|uniref:Uncharacterized protein n=1 Tax=Rhizoclosmatium globosum TaxID=329046 RepID=A0A1Y2BWB3_9FUNG|nr:hypothetical protein BCR33DRAFT_720307 [Rhizoclosmatium globosum]|eukprot:ORY39049.1 hypothetical protein BCR33DRAFT_720307 [Rhizoclosmatium globosum]
METLLEALASSSLYEEGRWWTKGLVKLYASFSAFKVAKDASTKKEEEEQDESEQVKEEKQARFVAATASHQPTSYSYSGTIIHLYCIYVSLSRTAWCLDPQSLIHPSHSSSFTWLSSFNILFPSSFSPSALFSCATRPLTFYSLCLSLQLYFYISTLLLRLSIMYAPPPYIPTLRNVDRLAYSYILPLINASVWLPLVLIPSSRVSYDPFSFIDVAEPVQNSIWNIYGLMPWIFSWINWFTSFLTFGKTESTTITVPGLSPNVKGFTSFWGRWIYGGLYSGPIFIWYLFNLSFRSAIGFYNWETDTRISTTNEQVLNLDDPAPDEYDGRMDGGRDVGWCRRMWIRFSGVLVPCLYFVLKDVEGFSLLEMSSTKKLRVGTDLRIQDLYGILAPVWLWAGVVGSGMLFSIWLNFLNYQHRLVVWRDDAKVVGVVIDEEDEELKVAFLY